MRGTIAAVTAISGLSNALSLAGSLFVLHIYDRVLATRSGFALAFLALVFGAMVVAAGLLELLRARILVRVGNAREIAALSEIGHALVSKRPSAGAKEEKPVNPLERLNAARQALGSPIAGALFDAVWSPLFFLALFVIHPVLGTTVVLSAGCVVLCVLIVQRVSDSERRRMRSLESAEGVLMRSIGAMLPFLWAAGRADDAARLWSVRRRADLVALTRAVDRTQGLAIMSRTVRALVQIVVLAAAAWLATRGDVSVGAIFAASILAGRALAPIELLGPNWTIARDALQALAVAREHGPTEPSRPAVAPVEGTYPVSVKLAHAYLSGKAGHEPVLKDVSLSVNAGELLGVMGAIGAGKSSLLRLITGQLPASAGTVRVADVDPCMGNEGRPPVSVGYLPQSPSFLPGTIEQNIASFEPDIDEAEAASAAERAGLRPVLSRLERGVHTVLDEAGQPLSDGERKLVALARAVYRSPRLLVLDMPETQVGPDGESSIAAAIDETRSSGGVVVLASHSLRLLRACTRIAVLAEGHVARVISPTELLGALREDRRAVRSA